MHVYIYESFVSKRDAAFNILSLNTVTVRRRNGAVYIFYAALHSTKALLKEDIGTSVFSPHTLVSFVEHENASR